MKYEKVLTEKLYADSPKVRDEAFVLYVLSGRTEDVAAMCGIDLLSVKACEEVGIDARPEWVRDIDNGDGHIRLADGGGISLL